MAPAEPEHEPGHLVEVARLDVVPERRAAEHRLDGRVAPVAGEQRAPDPLQRILLRIRVVGPAGDEPPGQRLLGDRRAAPERERPRVTVELDDFPRAATFLVEGRRAHPELVLLRREREAVHQRAGGLLGLAGRLEQPDRLRVLDQLLGRLLDAVEERPPDRLALALVVVEELRRQLLPGLEQRLSERGALDPLGRWRPLLLRLGERERAEAGERLGTALEQPVAQGERGDAVLLVVGGDRVQDRPVACLDVALVLDDRRTAVLDLGLPLEVEERLDLLEPVPLDRRRQAALDHLVEIDEDAAAEQVVHLGLARSVAAHQAAQRRDLVLRVVVDVQGGVLDEPGVHAIDEALERPPLARVVIGPQRVEAPADVEHAPEVLERALLVPERVAFDVEEQVAGRRVGQQRQAGERMRFEQLVHELLRLAPVELERGLATQLLERVGIDSGRARLGPGEPGERRDPARLQALDLAPVEARDTA